MTDTPVQSQGQKALQDLEELTKDPVPGLAEDVEEFEEKQEDWQAMYNAGGKFKEQLEEISKSVRVEERESVSASKEKKVTGLEEIQVSPEVEKKPELAGYIEEIEKDAELTGPVMDDYTQQILMTSPAPANPTVTLPLTEEQLKAGLTRQVWDSIRWLAEWCVRQIKMLPGKVRYRG